MIDLRDFETCSAFCARHGGLKLLETASMTESLKVSLGTKIPWKKRPLLWRIQAKDDQEDQVLPRAGKMHLIKWPLGVY